MGIRREIHNIIENRKFLSCGENVFVDKAICLDYKSIILGNNVHILKDARIQNVSGNHGIRICIGNNTGIQYRFSILAGANVSIGANVAIASDVFISSGSHGMLAESTIPYGCQPYLGMPIIIEDDVWIGEKVMVMSGVTIGKKSIIGAGGVVTKNIPPYCIAVGNPAKVIKKYNFNSHKWESVSIECN